MKEKPSMSPEELEAIRDRLGRTQGQTASLLDCLPLSYKRYEKGVRTIPSYIARSARMLDFIRENGLLKKFEKGLKSHE